MAEWERLPCGCHMGMTEIDGESAFIFEPHSRTCEMYQYFVEESARQGKPVFTLEVGGE
jgi:hypothetical protein